jgi:hypothetical protein
VTPKSGVSGSTLLLRLSAINIVNIDSLDT